jgi:hypothetical protein
MEGSDLIATLVVLLFAVTSANHNKIKGVLARREDIVVCPRCIPNGLHEQKPLRDLHQLEREVSGEHTNWQLHLDIDPLQIDYFFNLFAW